MIRAHLKKYRYSCGWTLLFCSLSWAFLDFADAYAWYLRDLAAGDLNPSVFEYLWRGTFRIYELKFGLLFYIPLSVVLLCKYAEVNRNIWLAVSIVMMLASASMIGEGGDRKGCHACLGVMYLYMLVLPVPAMVSGLVGVIAWRKSRGQSVGQG